jgi:hypothetical protein
VGVKVGVGVSVSVSVGSTNSVRVAVGVSVQVGVGVSVSVSVEGGEVAVGSTGVLVGGTMMTGVSDGMMGGAGVQVGLMKGVHVGGGAWVGMMGDVGTTIDVGINQSWVGVGRSGLMADGCCTTVTKPAGVMLGRKLGTTSEGVPGPGPSVPWGVGVRDPRDGATVNSASPTQ